MLEFIKNNLLLLIIGLALLILIVVLVVVIIKKNNNKIEKPVLDSNLLNTIYSALGLNNIVSITKEQDRIKLILNDVKLVETNVFTTNSIPVFLKGKELTILFRNFSNDLYTYLNDQLKK